MKKHFYSYLSIFIGLMSISCSHWFHIQALEQMDKVHQKLQKTLQEKDPYDNQIKDIIAQKLVTIYQQSEGNKKELLNHLLIIMINNNLWHDQSEIITQRTAAIAVPFERNDSNKSTKICPFHGWIKGDFIIYKNNAINIDLPTRTRSETIYQPNNFWTGLSQDIFYDLSTIKEESTILGCRFLPNETTEEWTLAMTKKTNLLVSPNHIPVYVIEQYMQALNNQDWKVVADIISYVDTFNIKLYPYKEFKPPLYKAIPTDNGVILMFGSPEKFNPFHIVSYMTIHQWIIYEVYANQTMTKDFYQNNWSLFTQKIKEIEREEVPPQEFTSQETTEGQNLSPDHPCYSDKQSKNFEELVDILLQQKICLDKRQKEHW